MTVCLMMNLKAGVGRTERLASYVIEQFTVNNIPYELITANSAEQAIELANSKAHTYSAVVAVGGDGSVHTAAQVAYRNQLPLGIIASGSGDDVARATGLPHGRNYEATQAAADHFFASYLANDKSRIDCLQAITADQHLHVVLAVMSCGFDSRVNANSSKMTYLKGTFRYIAAMLRTLGRFSPINYKTIIDGQDRSMPAMLMAVGNGSMFGGGMKVTPRAKVNDGLLDILIVHKVSIPKFLTIFPGVFTGAHLKSSSCEYITATSITMDAPGEQVWGDGEYLGPAPVRVQIQPLSIEIFGARLE